MKNHVIATPKGTALDEGLVQAYLHTHYRIHPSDTTEGFTLRIGVASEALRALMSHFHRPSAVFITAYNPLGQALSDADNQVRHRLLAQELAQRSFPHWAGVGEGDAGDWPGEESFLALGLELAAAQRLGAAHEQNAVVWAGPDAVPKLVLLR